MVDENTWLWDAFETLIENVERAIKPLSEYVETFSAFEEEFSLNPDKYVQGLDAGDTPISPEELRADIFAMKQKEEELKNKIPEAVIVNMFQVNCKDIRNLYAGKYAQIYDKEIKLIASKAKDWNYSISTRFGEIHNRILKPPQTIEDLTETNKFIAEIGIVIEKMKKEIDQVMDVYGILDEFNYEFSGAEQASKWELYGAPKKVMELIQQQANILEKQKEAMIKQMEQEQVDFEETLDNLGITVGGFTAYDNIDKYIENAKAVDNIDEKV